MRWVRGCEDWLGGDVVVMWGLWWLCGGGSSVGLEWVDGCWRLFVDLDRFGC